MSTLACGESHTVIVDTSHRVWVCGSNQFHKIGTDVIDYTERAMLLHSSLVPKTRVVATGQNHSVFVCMNGRVWVCGNNKCGQLGKQSALLGELDFDNIISAACGGSSTFLLTETGQVLSCGSNLFFQLGHQDNTRKFSTFEPVDLPQIVQISCGYEHTLFLDREGNVWGCGNNAYGQLAVGDFVARKPLQHILMPCEIISICCGIDFSLFIDNSGAVYSCGCNEHGQLGIGNTENQNVAQKIEGLPRITKVAAGNSHTLFLDESNTMWACGANNYEQLCMKSLPGDMAVFTTPIKVSLNQPVQAMACGSNYSVLWSGKKVLASGSAEHKQFGMRKHQYMKKQFAKAPCELLLPDPTSEPSLLIVTAVPAKSARNVAIVHPQ